MQWMDEQTKKGLAMTGLRQRSQKDALTGKRIPASFAWNRDAVNRAGNKVIYPGNAVPAVAVLGQAWAHGNDPFNSLANNQTPVFAPLLAAGAAAKLVASEMPSPASERRHSEEAINKTILASSKKKGLVFVFELLLKTLLEFQHWQAGEGIFDTRSHAYLERGKELKEKLQKLLYNIAYHSVLTEVGASNRRGLLLTNIKTRFDLVRPPDEVTNWKKLYRRNREHLLIDDLDAKIRAVRVYILGSKNVPGSDDPFDAFIHGSRNHRINEGGRRKRKTIKKKRKRTRKTRKSKRKKRKKRTKKRTKKIR